MRVEETFIKDLLLIKPDVHLDERGYFLETYNRKNFKNILDVTFVQDNESMSQKNVLRGLHFQKPPHAQGKLVHAITGSVLDVVVDIRTGSSTFGQHYKLVLSDKNKYQLYIPEGFAHGFLVLEEDSIFSYKCTNYYNRASESSLLWNDPEIGIDWEIDDPIISEKDINAEKFINFNSPF